MVEGLLLKNGYFLGGVALNSLREEFEGLFDASSFVPESGMHLMGFASLKLVELFDAIGLLLGVDFGVCLA